MGGGEVIWIDHHASARDLPFQELAGLRDFTDKGPAACELAWRYWFGQAEMPDAVRLVGDYDAWRLQDERSTPLRVALEASADAREPKSALWRDMLACGDATRTLVESGRHMILFRDGLAESLAASFGFETQFEGLLCYAVNLFGLGSAALAGRLSRYDAGLAFVYDGRRFTVSMYSTRPEVDCGAICKRHGGGGHKGAAGFTCGALPFARAAAEEP